jgi:hypothetical protein
MYFYPVYKICHSTGAFTRIGSLMESCRQWNVQHLPFLVIQAKALFAQRQEDVIVLGPRCADSTGTTVRDPVGLSSHSSREAATT